MEFPIPSSILPSVLLTFLIIIFTVLKVGKRSKTNNGALNLPPGPRKLPFIGNLHQLAALGSLPHRGLRQLAEIYGPFMHLQLGEISTIVVSSPEFAGQVMKTHDAVFASRPFNELANIMSYGYTDIIFSPYGEYWRKLRKICTLELLSLKRVQSLQSLREEEMANLINSIAAKAGSVMNFAEAVLSSTYGLTARAAFGKKCKDQEKFKAAIREVSQLLAGFHIADLFPSIRFLYSISGVKAKMEKLMQECDRILEKIVNEHKMADRSEGDKDLVDVLLKFQENGDPQFSLTTQNVKAVLFDVFSAGSDTSATLMEWAMSELIKNPRVMRKAQAEVRAVFNRKGKVDGTSMSEMKYLKLVIKETLRLHPAAPLLIPRESREPCEINGFNVPAKTKVMINAWAIARDPKYWMEPESFNPERFSDSSLDYRGTNFEYIPFGAGRRMCPGITYGLANVEFPLASLLYHFDWKLAGGMKEEDLEMEERFGVTITRKHDLRVIPILYQPETEMKVADYN